jgi:arylsulfatase A-like enzyme
MDLCNVKMPFKTDGKSMVDLMKKPSLSAWQEATYGYFSNGISVRTDKYRFTRYFRSELPNVELYDHQADPYENRNIASEHPELVEQLMPLWEKGNTGLFGK